MGCGGIEFEPDGLRVEGAGVGAADGSGGAQKDDPTVLQLFVVHLYTF